MNEVSRQLMKTQLRNNLLQGCSGQIMGHQVCIAAKKMCGPLSHCCFSLFVRSNALNKVPKTVMSQSSVPKLSQVQTYVVPDVRKGVRTPSTRTMFFTPGRARVFLLFV